MNPDGKSLAVFPGSFDPITNGHVDIIERGLSVFDEVTIAILLNPEKQPLFTVEERVEIIREHYDGNARVKVDTFSGLLVDYAEKMGASVIVRGLRAISDFEYEFQMALMNRELEPAIETVFLAPAADKSFLSSSLIREISALQGDVTTFVSEPVLSRIRRRVSRPDDDGTHPSG
jgi:pantetheine-phosphate adenylyltransferase